MKIIQIGYYPEDNSVIKGGVQASIYGLSKSLLEMGNEVVVLSTPIRNIRENYIIKEKKLTVYHFHNKYHYNILNIFYLKKLLSLIKKEKGEAVHVHGTSLLSLFLLICLNLKKQNVVLTVHGIPFIEFGKQWKKKKSVLLLIKFVVYFGVDFLCVNFSRKTIVDTEYVSRTLKKITRKKINIIPQGCDDTFYHLPDQYKKENIVSIGVISPRKGHEYSIKAISIVRKRFPLIRYRIIGVLREDLTSCYEELQQLVQKENLTDCVEFLINIPLEQLQQTLSQANLFVLHSAEESQGIVFCEAMAAKKPVVATNTGGIPYVVKNGINGLLSEYGDINTFANNIITIISNEKLRRNMSEQSDQLSQIYTWNNITKKILDLYSK